MKTLLLAGAVALGPWCAAQTTFTTIGDITFGSDGSTAIQIGGTTFVSGTSPTTTQILGSTLPATKGTSTSTVQKIGNVTFINDSNGSTKTIQKIGDITFGSDGVIVQKIGDTYFLTGGTSNED